MNPKSILTLLMWLAILGALALAATKLVGTAARKAESAL